jgi:hypothetical protein
VPNYVTESGFTTDISSRPKVGAPEGSSEFYLLDRERGTALAIRADSLPGITDLPDYVKDYRRSDTTKRKPQARTVQFYRHHLEHRRHTGHRGSALSRQ